ncbi:hypothetical protein BPAE_0347g00010 [Botrytis paeoniae]|uniref:Uncharacterized protein n=1 Tax=Botrytis paeoniae TaxID=278948 RepID=A0A4Z1FD21_9HELO|nr:hypothetical protein BPAE_0347g00010 [Botrytis paeoniae]
MSSPALNHQYKLRQGERSAIPSARQSHPRESVRSRGVSKHLNNNLHRESDTQTPPHSQRGLPKHVDPNHYRSVDAQVQPSFQGAVHIGPGNRRPMNARAPPHLQGEAPRYSDPIPHHPSNFQGQPAQQGHFNEGRRRGQPIFPQLVAAAADSRPLPQELNIPIRSVTESQRRERPPPPPPPCSFSESQLTKDNDHTRPQRHTDNVTGQSGWRQKDSSVTSSSRPRLPRPQPGSGSETCYPLEAPNLQQETVYSSDTRQLSQGILNDVAQLTIPIEGIRPARERDPNRDPYPGSEFPPDPRYGNQIRAGLPLRVIAGDQKQASSIRSSISDAHASGLRDGLSSRESSRSSPPLEDRRRSSSQIDSVKSNHPWQHSLPCDWKRYKSRGKIQDGGLLGKVLKQAGYVDATTPRGLVRQPKSKINKINSKGRGDRKSNHRSGQRMGHDNHYSEQFDDESVEGLPPGPPPAPPHQFNTRPLRHTGYQASRCGVNGQHYLLINFKGLLNLELE